MPPYERSEIRGVGELRQLGKAPRGPHFAQDEQALLNCWSRLQKTNATTITNKIKPPTLIPTVLPMTNLLLCRLNGEASAMFRLAM